MRLPESGVPAQVLVEELEQSPTRRYRYRLIVNAKRDVEALLRVLREGNQMFATRVVELNPWYRPIIAPNRKSFCFRVFWWGVAAAVVLTVLFLSLLVLSNEELKTQLLDTIELFKNG
jgi:hypothetical protein